MHCLVTAGPTYEPLDAVRRLTNFSTGQLGSELAAFLTTCGHRVTLLIGEEATYRGVRLAEAVEVFGTSADLKARLESHGPAGIDAVFHAAAVSDFAFGKIWIRQEGGRLIEVKAGKFSTRQGMLLAELVPTPKIIGDLRRLFPSALIVGWKFEVDGDRASVLELAKKQISESRTDACVANGPAYGTGFELIGRTDEHEHFEDKPGLFQALERLLRKTAEKQMRAVDSTKPFSRN